LPANGRRARAATTLTLPAACRRACAATALTIAALLAGCGGDPGSDDTGQPATMTQAGAPTAPATTTQPAALPDAAAQTAAIDRFVRNGQPIYCGGGQLPLVALTFDDGPGRYTPIVMRQLRDAGARATFFLVGRSVDRFPQTPRTERELAAIGDHSMTHPNLATLSPAAARAEIADGKAKALEAAGEPVQLFRPPYGSRTKALDREISSQGMAEILWDVDSTDSRITPPADFHEISARVRRNTRPGSIVLMHENRGQTIRAMRAILPALKRRHLQLVTVPELLAADPPSQAQLDKGRKGCKAGTADPRR
jgi:peptidoglycan/xylan/chitin deacetylase (PgdA/CDA1 family)